MTSTPARCGYRGCARPVHGDTGLCIFHAPADKKDPQEFRNALARQIRQWRNEKATMWDFSGWVFVDLDRKPESNSPWEKFNLFRRAVFPVDADFREVKFESPACFILSQFSGDAIFLWAAFSWNANFRSAAFSGDADFESAAFSRDATFRLARFEKANFPMAMFRGLASFANVSFFEMDLSYVVFAVEGHVSLGKLDKGAILRWPGPGKRYDEEGKAVVRGTLRLHAAEFASKRGLLDLRGNVLNDDTTLILEECDMSRILLGRLDWTYLRIVAPKWKCLGGRKTVGDEYVPCRLLRRSFIQGVFHRRKGSKGLGESDTDIRLDPTSVADTYLLLTKRFREDLKHAWANDFNCGAFAMNRLAPPDQSCIGQRLCSMLRKETRIAPLWWLKRAVYLLLLLFKRYFSLTALYGLTAGYGRSLVRPIASVVLVNLGAGLLYKGLENQVWWIPKVSCPRDVYKIGIEALASAVSVVTLRASPSNYVHPEHSDWAAVIGGIQIVLTATMAALTLFAVRRRFRHG